VTDENILLTASSAAGYIGRMFLRGEGVRQDARVAKMWFERGAEFSERECLNGLGIIYRDGLVKAEGEKEGKKDVTVANGYFGAAAGQDLAESQVNLGKYHYRSFLLFFLSLRLGCLSWLRLTDRGELSVATTYFETAIRHGSPFEAYYYIALMHSSQALNPSSPSSVVTGSCGIAVSFFKMVAERGSWKTDLLEGAYKMWVEGDEKDREGAKIRWWIAAERGVEVAQNNLAYVLDQGSFIVSPADAVGG
jgi:SEL1 protein